MRGVTGPIEEIILSVSRLKVPNFIRTPSSRRAKDVSKFCVNYKCSRVFYIYKNNHNYIIDGKNWRTLPIDIVIVIVFCNMNASRFRRDYVVVLLQIMLYIFFFLSSLRTQLSVNDTCLCCVNN